MPLGQQEEEVVIIPDKVIVIDPLSQQTKGIIRGRAGSQGEGGKLEQGHRGSVCLV